MTLPSDDSEQVMLRPGYRRHSRDFKERVVVEYDLLPKQTGERGSFLRAHRLGRHQISVWRSQMAGQPVGKSAGKTERVPVSRRPKRTSDQVEIDRLAKQNAKLQAELTRTRLALEITGKAHALLEMFSESAAAETEHERS
jgi:transposase